MMNWENIKRMLNENAMESAENNEKLLGEMAQVKADMAEAESTMITLQDLMRQTQIRKTELENKYEKLEGEYNKKKSITDSISKIFKTEKVVDIEVEDIDEFQFSQRLSSALAKLRYDFKKGAISETEFKQKFQELKDSIDELDI